MVSATPSDSPCIGVCILDANKCCTGCFRTVVEVSKWLEYTPTEKQRIIELCKQRKAASK